ncbi:MAG: stage 0 sporulation family protein [Dehalococcoidia bacterium]
MTKIAGLRFRKADPVKYAESAELDLHVNNYVVVQTEKGQEFGWVVREPKDLVYQQPDDEPMVTVVRKATSSDFNRWQQVKEEEEQSFKLARSKARELGLSMKIVDTHYTFDRSRLTVTFGAEGRVDFRTLIHALGAALRCRVEMHQVGERDVAKLTGGIGRCGRVLCCATWQTKFDAVGIRMAKEQALPISADGLAGACGRLRCCLRFEYEQYRSINRALPRIGEEVDTPRGQARVIVGHRMKETVSVQYANDEVLEWPLAEITRPASSKN